MPIVPASHLDLLQAPVAILATVGPDGRPQLSAVWFVADDDTIRISLNETRQKTRNLRRNPACTFFVLDPSRSSRYLEVRGDAEVEPDPVYAFAALVNAKYRTDVRVHDGPGEERVTVTVVPRRINAVDMAAG